jgi:hypothetical protein
MWALDSCVLVLLVPLAVSTEEPRGAVPRPDEPHRAAEARVEFLDRKGRLRGSAGDHWELGLWCERKGLEEEARSQFSEVIRLDPSRDAAWERLGYSRVDGRWLTEAQVAAAEAQEEANRVWGPRLSGLHDQLHDDRRREGARVELAGIDDPAAVPSVWNVFTRHGADDQLVAVQLLGQILTPESSTLLAMLAVHGRGESVRRAANETLRLRDPVDYAPALIDLMRPTLSYEYRPVSGPGERGMLVVSRGGDTLRRFYTAPGLPPVRVRPQFSNFVGGVLQREFSGRGQGPDPLARFAAGDALFRVSESYRTNVREARRAAAAANRQLASDVAGLEAINAFVVESNDRVAQILRNASGKNLPPDPEPWEAWLDQQAGRTPRVKSGKEVTQFLPLAYVPQYVTKAQFR